MTVLGIMASWSNPHYDLIESGDRLVRNDKAFSSAAEEVQVFEELARFVEAKMVVDYKLVSYQIPPEPEEGDPATSVLATPDLGTAEKLLIIIQNASGSQMGIFSRSLCLDQGISKGSMLPYLTKAVQEGFAVLIMRPNTNSITVTNVDGTTEKVPIRGSESPEIHALCVWENVVPLAKNAKHIALLGYGNGASLCHDLFLKTKVQGGGPTSISAFAAIEASHIVEEDDPEDIKQGLADMVVNLECCVEHAKGHVLDFRRRKIGVTSLSMGLPPGSHDLTNVAVCVPLALDSVFSYFRVCWGGAASPADAFALQFVSEHLPGRSRKEATVASATAASSSAGGEAAAPSTPRKSDTPTSVFSKIFGFSSTKKATGASPSGSPRGDESSLSVGDFDLLKIVGKGAFGKVMMVRRKVKGGSEGDIYAMKVLKKSVIAAKGQIEHTKSEQAILCEIRHPYIVRLRFSFQSEDKLYLVTDYYNAGTLFMHLRLSKTFDEPRAKLYGAQLLSALQHLHSKGIVYRDLKLENILMDYQGHIALTDFGLSKQDIDKSGGATTFCGTAEYIAPELLKGQKYGQAVDWWSFGILLLVAALPLLLPSSSLSLSSFSLLLISP